MPQEARVWREPLRTRGGRAMPCILRSVPDRLIASQHTNRHSQLRVPHVGPNWTVSQTYPALSTFLQEGKIMALHVIRLSLTGLIATAAFCCTAQAQQTETTVYPANKVLARALDIETGRRVANPHEARVSSGI